jgi:Fe-S cluster biogenesis protein NfuA/nitrite reductase/ring-hydroxylating ferredoxin subunit
VAKLEEQAFQKGMQQIEGLLNTIETIADPAVRASAEELIQKLLDLHGAGIERMMEIVADGGAPGDAIIDSLARDDLVGSLLLLYGLHPLDIETRVQQALEKVRPYLGSHGGNVELRGITSDGVVQLRLQGSCHGCPSSAMTLKLAIEEAIYVAAPDVTALEVEGVVERPAMPSRGVIPLELVSSGGRSPQANGHQPPQSSAGWETVDGLTSLRSGAVRRLEVSGRAILFCRLDESFYAYGDACPACGQTLGAARVESTTLICPTCGQHYDVLRAGRGLGKPDLYLEPFPLLVEHGQARVALPAF